MCKWEDNIKMVLMKDDIRAWIVLIWLRTGIRDKLL